MVQTDKEEDSNDDSRTLAVGENGIISVVQSKKRKKSNSKQTASDSLTKPGTCYRVLNDYMTDEKRPYVVKIGPIQQWLHWIATKLSTKQPMRIYSCDTMILQNMQSVGLLS